MAKAREILTEIKTKLSGLKRSEKIALGAFLATVLLALVLLSFWGTKTQYVPLVSGASDEEAKDIVTVLEEKGEEYKLEPGGKVLVRQERRPVLAGEISRRGVVPGEKLIGFSEIIDKDGFYTTRDRRKLMMQVALQNELALMIGNLAAVESAKVIIKEGQESDIFGEGRPGGASVTIRTRAGSRITPELVNSIAGIVKSAVPNIDPADITIVDSRNNKTFNPMQKNDELYEAPGMFKLKQDVETALADKVRGMFLHMGVDAVVVVNAELDLQKVAQKIQEVDPQSRGPFVTTERRSKRSLSEPPKEGGVVGIESNRRPGTQVGTGAGIVAGTAPELQASTPTTKESSDERESSYTYSYMLKEITGAPKGLARVSASVVLFDRIVEKDGKITYDSDIISSRMEDWKQLVSSALGIGIDADVVVKHVPSTGPAPVVAGVGLEYIPFEDIVTKGVLLVLALAAFFVLFIILRRMVRPAAAGVELEPLPSGGTDRITQLQRAIRDQVGTQPDRLSRILSRWIVSK
jgi:flagellar M-ring protein FliF